MLGLVFLLVILINLQPVQDFLSQKAANILAEKLQTKVTVKNIRFHLLNKANLEGLYLEDQHGDTLMYAGNAEVNITDWFIFKEKPVLTYIGLVDASVYLHRSKNSDEWNYQFLVDAFSTNNKPKKKREKSGFNISLKEAKLENVRFNLKDEWVGSDMGGSVGHLVLKVKDLDFKNRTIDLRSLIADKIVFGLTEYTGGRPPNPRGPMNKIIDTTAFNPDLWKVSLKEMKITNNRFFLEYPETEAPMGLFDEDHLNITGINVFARNLSILGDTIKADVTDMQARERCGLTIKNMRAQITISPNVSECKNLYLETGNSVLTDYYAMKYERFPDFLDYIEKVKMVGNLKNADIGIQDIIYFAPELKRFDRLSVRISGEGMGTVARLNAQNLVLSDGFSELKGGLSIDGLPDIRSTFIDFRNGEIKTSGAAAIFYVPELKKQTIADFASLKQVDFKGNFTGFLSDFVAYGAFHTNLGNLKADVNMKLPKGQLPAYSGNLSTDNFDIGKLFYQDYAGKISFSANVKGRGFQQKDIDFDVDGKVDHFFINDYDYQNINIQGKLKKNRFDGSLSAADPNLMMNFTGKMDFSGETPLYDFFAKIDYINAQALKLTDDNLSGSATLQSNFEGNNIDDFLGSANVYNMNLVRDSLKLNFDSLSLISKINNGGEKQLILQTNDLYASVYGHFNLIQLPHSFQLFLSYYLPEYINTPPDFDPNQNLRFSVKANQKNDLVSLFNKDIKIGDSTDFEGSLDMAQQQLTLNGEIPEFSFRGLVANNVQLNVLGTYSGLDIQLKTDDIYSGEDNLVSKLSFSSVVFRDSAQFQLLTSSLDNNIEEAQLNGVASAFKDSFYVSILNSSFNLNKEHWKIPKGNSFVFSKNYFFVKDLKILSGKQHIFINPSNREALPNNAFALIENMNLSALNDIFGWGDFKFTGLLNGNIEGKDLLDKPIFEFNVNSQSVQINDDTLGIVDAIGSFDLNKRLLSFEEGSGIRYKDAAASVLGVLDFGKNEKGATRGEINFKDAKIAWVQPVLKNLVHDITGTINGNIKVAGSIDGIKTSGQIDLFNAGFTPDIIGSHFIVKKGTVKVTPDGFDFGDLVVYDDYNNKGICTGTINHNSFRDFIFNLRFNSDNMEVVNLKSTENEHYYGKVFASFQARITGPFENLNMNVFATPQKNSSLFIPIGYGSDLGVYNYIHFKGSEKDSLAIKPNSHNKINFRLDAVATPDLLTTIILDPSSGDRIVAKGSGNIILEIPSDDELKMNGSYIIEQGTYDFSFKQLQVLNYKKQFTINSNSSIKWNGEITDADLDVSAYATIKARLYDLIQGEADRLSAPEIKDAQTAQNVNVLMKMKGSLSAPDMKFNIELTEGRSIGTYAYQKLQRINTDEKELLNQVASLLLLDQFVSEGLNNASISSGTINNMSQLLSSALSSQITNFASKLLGTEDLSIGLSYKNYALSDVDPMAPMNYYNRNEAGLNLRKKFFNDRLTVEVGGVYDWGRTAAAQSFQDNLAGDFRLQYLLSEDGRVRFEVFRNSNFDALSLQNISRQGVGINFRKSFNGFNDFFNLPKRSHFRDSTEVLLHSPQIKELQMVDSLHIKDKDLQRK